MKLIKNIGFLILLILSLLWLLTWTPLFNLMPQNIKQFMFVFGGILTFLVPITIVFVVAHFIKNETRN